MASHCRLPFGRLTSSNVATWVLSAQVSNAAPQTSQDTWPLCGIKHVGSTRLYSAPHSHRTSVVSIFEVCARNHPFSSVDNCHNQTDSLPAVAMSMIVLASWLGPQGAWDGIYHSSSRVPHPRGPTPFESELVIPETIVRLDRLAGMQLLARRPFLGLIPSRATGQS